MILNKSYRKKTKKYENSIFNVELYPRRLLFMNKIQPIRKLCPGCYQKKIKTYKTKRKCSKCGHYA